MFWVRVRTATGLALLEHARNRLALWLVVAYIPIWTSLIHGVIADTPVRFLLRSSGETLTTNGNHLTQISGTLNAVTLIVGFMMFMVTFKSGPFDRRLAMAGYPRGHLIAAKVVALVLVAAVISVYASVVTQLYWTPKDPVLLTVAVFTAALTYGALGVALATVLRGELEGMFCIIMISIVDISLQNPIPNPSADSGFLRFLPAYGAMQAGTAAGFSTTTPVAHLQLECAWFAVLTAIGTVVFLYRTRLSVTSSALRR
jgi:ABC-2 type transport system permease protein